MFRRVSCAGREIIIFLLFGKYICLAGKNIVGNGMGWLGIDTIFGVEFWSNQSLMER